MEITIHQLIEGAHAAKGTTVVIDVFRAFSTACYVAACNAHLIYPVGSVDEAFSIKASNPDCILIGERQERKPEGFDYGNSPTQIRSVDFAGKDVVLTTSSGTQGIVHATNASEILTGSFVNVSAIIRYIRQTQPEQVSLVCMGFRCEYPTDEDTFLAEYIKNELEGKPNHFNEMIEILRKGDGSRFFAPENQAWSPSTDFDLCLDIDRFDFILKAEIHDERLCLKRTQI